MVSPLFIMGAIGVITLIASQASAKPAPSLSSLERKTHIKIGISCGRPGGGFTLRYGIGARVDRVFPRRCGDAGGRSIDVCRTNAQRAASRD